jgi:hypothetical protein
MSFTVFSIVGGTLHGKTLATDEAIDGNAEFELVESPTGPRIIGVVHRPRSGRCARSNCRLFQTGTS